MEALPAHPTAPRDAQPEPAAPLAEDRLLDDVSWWMAHVREEPCPRDRLWLDLRCGACERSGTAVLRLTAPWTTGAPAWISASWELEARLREAARARPSFLDADAWRDAHACACGAPEHHRRVTGVALLRAMPGSGAGLVAAVPADAGALRRWRVPIGGAAQPLSETDAIDDVFGTPLSQHDGWAPLLERLPAPPDLLSEHVIGVESEPGVWLLIGPSREALRWALAQRLGDAPHLAVDVAPEGLDWPARLEPLADAAGRGAGVVAVERDAAFRQVRAFARGQLHMDARMGEDATDGHVITLSDDATSCIAHLEEIALRVAKRGAPLAWAVAGVLSEAAEASAARLGVLKRLVDQVPGASFELERGRVHARRPDGTPGRVLELASLPRDVDAVDEAELARHAAFLFDLAPAWADPTRVCPCGAASTVERRVVPWPWTGEADSKPMLVERLEPEGADSPGVAVVVALCCDRHVRVPAAVELERMGLAAGGEALERRLAEDAPRRAQRVRAWVHEAPDGGVVILAEAPMIAAYALEDARLAALHHAVGAPFGALGEVFAWAAGPDVLVMGPHAACADALGARGHLERAVPFMLQRVARLDVPPAGTIHLAPRGRS